MMTKPNDSAFPWIQEDNGTGETGLTKRELFAAMAMQGMLTQETEDAHFAHIDDLSKMAVKRADSLLAELAKSE